MTIKEPLTELDPSFSSAGATPTPWVEAITHLEKAGVYWLTTIRPEGRPHVTPVIAVWLDGALYFSTGESERKAKNLASNPHCVITTGCNSISEGLDLVVEGDALRVSDAALLQRLVDMFEVKYAWGFTVSEGGFNGGEGNIILVYEVAPTTAFGFGKGEPFSQTRWRF